MQIAFWSGWHGQTCTTTNTSVTAVNMAMKNNLDILLMHTQYSKSNMETAFYDGNEKELFIKFEDTGIDALERLSKTGRMKPEEISSYAKKLIPERLSLLNGSTKANQQLYKNMESTIEKIMDCARQSYDIIMVDVNSGKYDQITNKVLETSDVIVVNIDQNETVIKAFFDKQDWNKYFEEKELILLIGRYDKNSYITPSYIKRTYGYKNEIYTVPYSVELMDSINKHNLINYFYSNVNAMGKEKDSEFHFINEINKFTDKIISLADVEEYKTNRPLVKERKSILNKILNIV